MAFSIDSIRANLARQNFMFPRVSKDELEF